MSFKLKINSAIQARVLLESPLLQRPRLCNVPLHELTPTKLPSGSRLYSMTGLEAVGIAMDAPAPSFLSYIQTLDATRDFQVRISDLELTSALSSSTPKSRSSLSNFGSEKEELYPRDPRTSALRNLARAGNHEMFEDMRKKFFADAEQELAVAGILGVNQPYHDEGRKVIRELLKKGSIPEGDYFKVVGRDIGMRMLGGGVFELELDSRMITFQSTVMREYCRQKSAQWV